MTDKDFDMERLAELHAKAEREGLTDEEIEEVNGMMRHFLDTMGPVVVSLGDIIGNAIVELGEALQPAVEALDRVEP